MGVTGLGVFGLTCGVVMIFEGGLGDLLGGESILSKSFWFMPGGNGSLDRLLVLKTNWGFGVSDLMGTVTKLLGVLYFAIAGDSGKAELD